MQFLGMTRPAKTVEELTDNASALKAMSKEERKRVQDRIQKEEEYEAAKATMKDDIEFQESEDIIETQIRKRQDWVQQWKEIHKGDPPKNIAMYYEKDKEPEEEKKDDDDGKKGKKKKDAKKETKGKKGKKGKEKDEKKRNPVEEVGPTEIVKRFEMQYEDYEEIWAKRDESANYD